MTSREPHPSLIEPRAERLAQGLRQADVAILIDTLARCADALGYDLTPKPPLPPITPEQAAHNQAVLKAALADEDPTPQEAPEGTDTE